MQINITTFAGRKHHYIHDTLRSLFRSDWRDTNVPINLIVGSDDETQVQEYAEHPSVRIVPWDVQGDANLRFNCTLNKIRALRWGDDEATLICEDDIDFRPDWLAFLRKATAELGDPDYVLSLFAATPELEQAAFVQGKSLIKRYPMPVLQGAQAIFYPSKAIRHRVADYLTKNLRIACGDQLIGRCARSIAMLYATREILVNHVGVHSCFEE